ncbi:C39 family peptidase, partial [Candidatus Roizmanbacteria bacterium]|nr:C39 family peptidase [Candidatus Roizmanbacteria bacterium]
LLTSLLARKSVSNSQKLKTKTELSSIQIESQTSFKNNQTALKNKTNNQFTSITSSPTPTRSPLSAFSSALSNLYGGPNINNQRAPASFVKSKITPSPTPDPINSFISALNILLSGFSTNNSVTQELQEQSSKENALLQSSPSNKVYYSQCNDTYDNYLLPQGCNICKAGCGPTTVAMILSSYIDKKFTPSYVVDLYKQNGFAAGCKGTTVGDSQQILEQNGMKTTDLLYYAESPYEEIVTDLKSYLKNGWTIYMLAKFCPKGCGHFFWIVDIDNNNNVWTYDPGYGNIDGRKIVPLNEITLNPPAQYYVAFGVRNQ